MAMSRNNGVKTLTASTTQTQAACVNSPTRAFTCDGDVNVVTVGNAGDAVMLPADLPKGTVTYIINASAVADAVFPPPGGTINGGAANASTSLAASKGLIAINIGGNNFRAMASA